ncbi:MAG: IS91 family transposase, partial [Desulfobacterium sp.]|nr:IS91 family transposase [Desulfobacterium sp.]
DGVHNRRILFFYESSSTDINVKLSRCAWKILSVYLKHSLIDNNANPGAVIAVQTFGDFQNFNPHLHIIATDSCFTGNRTFQVGHCPKPSDLEDLFRNEVLKMLKAEGKINDVIIANILSWHHTG